MRAAGSNFYIHTTPLSWIHGPLLSSNNLHVFDVRVCEVDTKQLQYSKKLAELCAQSWIQAFIVSSPSWKMYTQSRRKLIPKSDYIDPHVVVCQVFIRMRRTRNNFLRQGLINFLYRNLICSFSAFQGPLLENIHLIKLLQDTLQAPTQLIPSH